MSQPDVVASWQRMTSWFAQHAVTVAAIVREPASKDDLALARDAVRCDLPEDLVAWWRLADGVTDDSYATGPILPPLYHPWPILDALYSRQMWLDVWTDGVATAADWGRPDPATGPAGTRCDVGWVPSWLPIANDRSGSDLFVDLRPGPLHGCVMEFDRVEGARGARRRRAHRVGLPDMSRSDHT